MALQVSISATLSQDCTTLYFFETTGVYDAVTNTGGYSAPNPETIEFSTATLTLLLAGATVSETPINIFGGLLFPSALTTRAWQINASDFGLTTFPIGLTRITYRINNIGMGDDLFFMATTLFLTACEYECCIEKKKLDIAKNPPSSCDCKEDTRITDMLYAEAILEAAQAATCCGDVASVNNNLSILKKICGSSGCSNC